MFRAAITDNNEKKRRTGEETKDVYMKDRIRDSYKLSRNIYAVL